MEKLSRSDLYPLEQYAEMRHSFRDKVMAHKRFRSVALGEHITLYFEDRLTMQYQIQEMLRVERIFEADGIQEELDVYNPLIPDGCNWKATMMIEYPDVDERRVALTRMTGIEHRVWVQVEGFERVWAIADEDLERSSASKTSSVHFLRFELSPEMAVSARNAAGIAMGVDHEAYTYSVPQMTPETHASLVDDLEVASH